MGETRQKLVLPATNYIFCLIFRFFHVLIIWMILPFLRLENLKINTTVYIFAFVVASTFALGCVCFRLQSIVFVCLNSVCVFCVSFF